MHGVHRWKPGGHGGCGPCAQLLYFQQLKGVEKVYIVQGVVGGGACSRKDVRTSPIIRPFIVDSEAKGRENPLFRENAFRYLPVFAGSFHGGGENPWGINSTLDSEAKGA